MPKKLARAEWDFSKVHEDHYRAAWEWEFDRSAFLKGKRWLDLKSRDRKKIAEYFSESLWPIHEHNLECIRGGHIRSRVQALDVTSINIHLFDIDWSAMMDKLVPDWAKKILPGFGGDSREDAQEEVDDAKSKLTSTQQQIAAKQGQMGAADTSKVKEKWDEKIRDQREKTKEDVKDLDDDITEMMSRLSQSQLYYDTGGVQGEVVQKVGDSIKDEEEVRAKIRAEIEEKRSERRAKLDVGAHKVSELEGKKSTAVAQVISEHEAKKIQIQEEIKALQVRELEEQTAVAEAIKALAVAGVEKQDSIAVHDRHVERAIYGLMQGAAAQTQLLAAYGNGGNGGGGTTVNNVTVAPSTSNTVSSIQKSENTYGTVDPYTAAAGAYG